MTMRRKLPSLAAAAGRLRASQPAVRFTAVLAVCALVVGAQGLAVDGWEHDAAGEVRVADPSTLVFSGMLPDPGRILRAREAGAALPAAGRIEAGQPAEGAADRERPALAEGPIATTQPSIRLDADGPVDGDPVQTALAVEGTTFATAIRVGELALEVEDGIETVAIAAVDVEGFRTVTPQVSADHTQLWERIVEGDAAFTHDVGTRLDLELGSRVPLAGDDEDDGEPEHRTVRVGALASNGAPPVADAIVSLRTARELELDTSMALLVSVAQGADTRAVAARLAEATGMRAELISVPRTRRAFMTGAATRDAFEPFSYVSLGDGMIQIDPAWTARNIVTEPVPVFRGPVTCHRLLMPQLRGALEEVVERGLDHLIDPSQYGGCWVPRHILFNPNRALSMHAWGLAIDFNVKGNEYGNRNPQMDRRIVEIFERWGFSWGGHWSTPDGMHFELGALLEDSVGG